ncbi:MAG TPA: DUF2550 domain-containing protein [Jatrophihabitans sp.]|nr:DUF2550 domain-containing protein [Jatrophihabitans sp.]
MHTVDVIVVCAAVLLLVAFAAILARQRYMLRLGGTVPLAVQTRGNRWMYGIGRYQGGELRWYRALGIGTRPSRVLRRGEVEVLRRRGRLESERTVLPPTVVVVECRTGDDTYSLALGDSAFTGFVSWLESSAPHS